MTTTANRDCFKWLRVIWMMMLKSLGCATYFTGRLQREFVIEYYVMSKNFLFIYGAVRSIFCQYPFSIFKIVLSTISSYVFTISRWTSRFIIKQSFLSVPPIISSVSFMESFWKSLMEFMLFLKNFISMQKIILAVFLTKLNTMFFSVSSIAVWVPLPISPTSLSVSLQSFLRHVLTNWGIRYLRLSIPRLYGGLF